LVRKGAKGGPIEQIERTARLTDNCRNFRSLHRRLLTLDDQVGDLLRAYETEMSQKTRSALGLGVEKPKNAAESRNVSQKRTNT
jgi:hypothetical protein